MAAIDAEGLRRRMTLAAKAGDYETAAILRDELRDVEAGKGLRRQREGAMGLGADQPTYARPPGWTPPKRPDPLTSGIKRRRGGR